MRVSSSAKPAAAALSKSNDPLDDCDLSVAAQWVKKNAENHAAKALVEEEDGLQQHPIENPFPSSEPLNTCHDPRDRVDHGVPGTDPVPQPCSLEHLWHIRRSDELFAARQKELLEANGGKIEGPSVNLDNGPQGGLMPWYLEHDTGGAIKSAEDFWGNLDRVLPGPPGGSFASWKDVPYPLRCFDLSGSDEGKEISLEELVGQAKRVCIIEAPCMRPDGSGLAQVDGTSHGVWAGRCRAAIREAGISYAIVLEMRPVDCWHKKRSPEDDRSAERKKEEEEEEEEKEEEEEEEEEEKEKEKEEEKKKEEEEEEEKKEEEEEEEEEEKEKEPKKRLPHCHGAHDRELQPSADWAFLVLGGLLRLLGHKSVAAVVVGVGKAAAYSITDCFGPSAPPEDGGVPDTAFPGIRIVRPGLVVFQERILHTTEAHFSSSLAWEMYNAAFAAASAASSGEVSEEHAFMASLERTTAGGPGHLLIKFLKFARHCAWPGAHHKRGGLLWWARSSASVLRLLKEEEGDSRPTVGRFVRELSEVAGEDLGCELVHWLWWLLPRADLGGLRRVGREAMCDSPEERVAYDILLFKGKSDFSFPSDVTAASVLRAAIRLLLRAEADTNEPDDEVVMTMAEVFDPPAHCGNNCHGRHDPHKDCQTTWAMHPGNRFLETIGQQSLDSLTQQAREAMEGAASAADKAKAGIKACLDKYSYRRPSTTDKLMTDPPRAPIAPELRGSSPPPTTEEALLGHARFYAWCPKRHRLVRVTPLEGLALWTSGDDQIVRHFVLGTCGRSRDNACFVVTHTGGLQVIPCIVGAANDPSKLVVIEWDLRPECVQVPGKSTCCLVIELLELLRLQGLGWLIISIFLALLPPNCRAMTLTALGVGPSDMIVRQFPRRFGRLGTGAKGIFSDTEPVPPVISVGGVDLTVVQTGSHSLHEVLGGKGHSARLAERHAAATGTDPVAMVALLTHLHAGGVPKPEVGKGHTPEEWYDGMSTDARASAGWFYERSMAQPGLREACVRGTSATKLPPPNERGVLEHMGAVAQFEIDDAAGRLALMDLRVRTELLRRAKAVGGLEGLQAPPSSVADFEEKLRAAQAIKSMLGKLSWAFTEAGVIEMRSSYAPDGRTVRDFIFAEAQPGVDFLKDCVGLLSRLPDLAGTRKRFMKVVDDTADGSAAELFRGIPIECRTGALEGDWDTAGGPKQQTMMHGLLCMRGVEKKFKLLVDDLANGGDPAALFAQLPAEGRGGLSAKDWRTASPNLLLQMKRRCLVLKGREAKLKNKICLCGSSSPSFGLPGEPWAAARWCSKCPQKPPNALDIVNRRCLCGSSSPSFGLSGEPAAAARWCSKCPQKPPNAVDIKSRKCLCGSSWSCFGLPGEPKAAARWCSKCPQKPPNAVDVVHKRCLCGSSQPSFGLHGEPKAAARWCSKCPQKPPNAVDIVNRKCLCGSNRPSFGLPGEPKAAARWCSKCPQKPPNAVDIVHRRCLCGSNRPFFGLPGEPPGAARWCSKCPQKPPNAVNVNSKKCLCGSSQPSFGLPGEPKAAARWCSKCPEKPPNAVDIVNRKCLCGSNRPSFGLPGEPPGAARWCSKCPQKPPNAVDIVHRRCLCGSNRPFFGLPGEPPGAARWCSKCPQKPPNAVNVNSKKCLCGSSQPSFGLPGEPKAAARWCSKCPEKPPNAVDIVNRKCLCGSNRPFFGLPGEPPGAARWCSKCPQKPPNAVNVNSKKCLCGSSQPCFGLPEEPAAAARWCSKCPQKPPNAVDVVHMRCLCGSSRPSFGLPGELRAAARWCSKCPQKPPNAVDVMSRRCLCGSSQPSFGLPGELPGAARWCSKCPEKPPNAVDVKSRRCLCGSSQPSFGLPGELPGAARWCSKCPEKPPNAVDVMSKRCLCGRSTNPHLGLPGEPASAARWCSKCPEKPSNAVDIKHTHRSRCLCGSSRPSFGLPGELRAAARWCSKCPQKPPNAVDVMSKRCLCGRSTNPHLGLPGEPASAARWCSKCPEKPSNAVDIKHTHRSRCLCGSSSPSFGLPGELRAAARWCSKCPEKPPNAVDVKNKRCLCGSSSPSFGLPGELPGAARWCSKCPQKPPDAVNVKKTR